MARSISPFSSMAGAPPHSILLGFRQLPLMRTVAMIYSQECDFRGLFRAAHGVSGLGLRITVRLSNVLSLAFSALATFPILAIESNSCCSKTQKSIPGLHELTA